MNSNKRTIIIKQNVEIPRIYIPSCVAVYHLLNKHPYIPNLT